MSRRDTLRAKTLLEIKTIAHQQMQERGTAALSLNAIAKTMDMSTPALYRYYADRDALITELIVDAYNAFADALEAVAKANTTLPVSEQILLTMLAYRTWALEHPVDFQLIYGNPIPGYVAPFERTAPAARRTFYVFLNQLTSAARSGKLRVPPLIDSAFSFSMPDLSVWTVDSGLPIDILYVGVVGWTRIHGLITLEMFHHLQMVTGDLGALYRHEVVNLLREFGLWDSTPA